MAKKEENLDIILDVRMEGEGAGRHEFSQKSVIIGSGPAANLRLEDDSVSSIHAILKAGEGDTALVSDLGSEDGTRVNGEEIRREASVKRGDSIAVGGVEVFVVGVGNDEVDTKTERPPVREAKQEEVKAPTPVQRPPKKEKRAAQPPSPRTEIVRRREIPKASSLGAVPSGQLFFERETHPMERPSEGAKLLEVKVMWGPIVLDVRQFRQEESVMVGDQPDASIRITTDRFGGDVFTLASPGGTAGHVIHVASGMELDVRRDGSAVSVDDLPSAGAVRTYSLKINDKARVMMGQLGFVIQYVTPSKGIVAGTWAGADYRATKWLLVFFVLALGLWTAIHLTPRLEMEVSDYLKNPARFAQLIMPTSAAEKKKTFEEIKKKEEEKIKVEDAGKWKKVESKKRAKDADVPREVKEKRDRKVATSAGILGLLKKRGGGQVDVS